MSARYGLQERASTRVIVWTFLAFSSVALAQTTEQQRVFEQLRTLDWQRGPTEGAIGSHATIKVPVGHFFLNSQNTSKFLRIAGNPPASNQYAFGPESLSWFAVFNFTESGYVKDDEQIDGGALLKVLQDSDKPANEERKKLGMEALYTDGWLVPPHYDMATKRLEWGVRLHSQSGDQVINYTSRLLGRTGYISATLVSSPDKFGADMEVFRRQLAGFSFVPGQTYVEFREGDKVAEYGLGALIVGGAAAAAAKSGLLKSLGKFLWVIVIGAFAAIGALWKKITGRNKE